MEIDIKKNNFIFNKIDKKNINLNYIHDFYFNVCKKSFDEHELEDYFNWENAFNKKNIYTSFIIITLNNEVIGGVVSEIYSKSNCCLISYIAINDKYRGMGLSKILIEETIKDTKEYDETIEDIFIEVLKPENEFDIARQKIWKKLNFLPFDLYFQHPGKLKWRYYQMAKYNINNEEKIIIDKQKLLLYFTEFFQDLTCEIIVRCNSNENISQLSDDEIDVIFDSENYSNKLFIKELNIIKENLDNEEKEFITSIDMW